MKKYFLIFLLFPFFAGAYYNPGVPAGFVNDYAEMLSSEQRAALEQKLSIFEEETSNEIAVVTIPSLRGDTIENFAVTLFKEWGVGKENRDNGILLLIARDERKIRIEVGYGLEGALTDAQSFQIIDTLMKPAFRAEEYYGGIDEATDAMIVATRGEYISYQSDTDSGDSSTFYGATVWFFVIILLQMLRMLAVSKSWWGGGVVGGIAGFFITLFFGLFYIGLAAIAVLIPLGLLIDFFLSRSFSRSRSAGVYPWWFHRGGGSPSSGSGSSSFGGFGGGHSGGGGASSDW